MGAPSSSMNCLRLVPDFSRPMRVPRPAAGSMTETFIRRSNDCTMSGTGAGGLGGLPRRPFSFVHGVRALVEAAEDHLARGGLQDAGYGHVDGLRNHLA